MFNEAKFPCFIFKIGKGVIGRWKIIPEVLVLILHDSYEFDSRDSYITAKELPNLINKE